MDYDLPDFFCTITDAWPPGYGCTNDPNAYPIRLTFFINGGVDKYAYIYYENGTWDPNVELPCGTTSSITYSAWAEYNVIVPGGTQQLIRASSPPLTLTPHCGDRRTCPVGTSVSEPINVGSGDVMVTVPMFSLNSQPLALPFALTYHSGVPNYPSLVTSPVGLGWSHPYSQSMRATDGSIDGTGKTLYHITAEGFESEYAHRPGDPAGVWTASSPGELRGTVALVGSGATGEYQLTDLDGTLTAFDLQTGHWKRTQDRWGNQIVGTYSGGNLTAIADMEGRQITLAYTASQVTITLPGGLVWKLALSGGLLTGIFDPLHSGATPWRSFSYLADHAVPPVTRLFSTMTDDASKILEQHTYDSLDRGISGSAEGGKSNVTIQYDVPATGQRRVTHTIDASTTQTADFTMVYQMGRWLPTLIQGSCATCSAGGADQTSFTYDHFNNQPLQKIVGTGSDQVETDYTYDANALVVAKIEAAGRAEERTTTYTYAIGTPHGFLAPWPRFLTSVTDSSVVLGACCHSVNYNWSQSDDCSGQGLERCLETSETGWLTTGPLSSGGQVTYTTSTVYDAKHRQTNSIGPNSGQSTDMTYFADAATNNGGRLSSTVVHPTTATSLTTTYDNYDLFGSSLKVVDPNGVETDATTDSRGRIRTRTSLHVTGDSSEATDYTTTYTFDSRDRLTDVQLPRSNKTSYVYEDGTNRLTDTIRVDTGGLQQERLHLVLNTIGGKITEQAQSCNTPAASCAAWTTKRTESYAYDTNNRLHTVTHADGSAITYAYDSRANILSVQDERHTAPNTTYAYDGINRLTSVVQKQTLVAGPDVVTGYQYSDHDDLTQVTDPNGNVTTYQYNDFRRMEGQVSPVSGSSRYAYDPAGDLVSTTDGNGALTTRTYDGLLRPLSSTSSAGGKTTETTTWIYDQAGTSKYGFGRLTTMADTTGSTQYSYERRGLLKLESVAFVTTVGSSYSTTYGYDPNGNRRSITYPSGNAVTFAFDFADRPSSARSTSTVYVSNATYLPFGPLKDITYGNGTSRSGTFDQRYQPQELKLVKGASTLADHTYQFDGAGNVLQLHDAVAAAYNRDFGYDDLNRVTTANSGASLWGTGSYAYDSMGNMKSLTLGGTSRAAQFFYSGTTPKLTSVRESSSRNVSYDAAGNETLVGTSGFVYSARNLLVDGDGNSYVYDGRGLRRIVNMGEGIPLASVNVSPSSVVAGTSANGTVTLSVKAPVGGSTVFLTSSDSTAASVPSTVTVPADFPSVGFTITTSAVTTVKTVTITASFAGTTKMATLTVTPSIAVTGLTVSPTSVIGGNNSVGTVTLNAPSQGTSVTLGSSNTSAATVPASIIVPYGNLTTTFVITTKGVAATATSSISASTPSGSRAATQTVTPASLTGLSLSPVSIPAGTASTGTLSFNGQTPPGGATVSLSTNPTGFATVPVTTTVPGGAISGTFQATGVVAGSTQVKATYGAANFTQTLTVTPPVIASVTVSPAGVNAGSSTSGWVTLTAAVSSAATVTLSSNSANATVPSSVTVAAGQSVSSPFTITTSSSAPPTTVTITGTYPTGVSKTATLQILNDGSSTIYTTQTPSGTGTVASERGTSFHSSQSGYITTLRFYKVAADTATSHTMRLWGTDPLAPALATLTISNETASGWQEADLPVSVPITAGTVYRVSYSAGATYAKTTNGLTPPIVHGPLTTNNGVNGTTGQFPSTTSSDSFFADVRYSATPLGGVGLLGNYYSDTTLTSLQFCRVDPTVDFNWPTGYPFSPPPATPDDTFSVRWSGKVQPQFTETYTFYTYSDDGVRLWVNNQLLIDKWVQQTPTEWSGQVALVEGSQYDIKLEYFDGGSNADAHLSWSSPSRPKQIIPATRLLPANGLTVSLTSPANNSTFPAGGTVSLSATASAGLGVAKVQFFYGGTNLIGESTGPNPYTFSWTAVPAGSYTLTAVAIDTAGCTQTSAPVTVNVVPLAISSVTLSSNYASAGQTLTGTVTMSAAPQVDTTINLATLNSALASVPVTTTVHAGQLTATFSVSVSSSVPGSTAPVAFTISASMPGSTASATLKFEPRLLDVRLAALGTRGGGVVTGYVTMTGLTADRSISVNLSSSDASLTVPSTVSVSPGSSSASFTATTGSVTQVKTARLTATLGSVTRTFDLVINPGTSISVDRVSYVGGEDDATVTATLPAPPGHLGALVIVDVYIDGVQDYPLYIEIGPNDTTGSVQWPTSQTPTTETVMLKHYNAGDIQFSVLPVTQITQLTLQPTPPASLSGTNVALATVTVSPGTSSFEELTLTTTDSQHAIPQIPVFANLGTTATFYVTCYPVDTAETVTITATAPSGYTHTAQLQLVPQTAELRRPADDGMWTALAPATVPPGRGPEAASFHLAALGHEGLWSVFHRGARRTGAEETDYFGVEPSGTPQAEPKTAAPSGIRFSFYSPEMSLLAETELKPLPLTQVPAILYEYIWLGGIPVAQVDSGTVTHWTFTDHLGTPIIQTDVNGAMYWQAEYEPYGKVWALRTADQHQPLRLPGQEAEQLNLGANGATERFYNVFRWYHYGWGRYNQSDPIGLDGGINVFAYVNANPLVLTDPEGLAVRVCCRPLDSRLLSGYNHCYVESNAGGRRRVFGLHIRDRKGVPRFNDESDKGGVCTPWRSDPCEKLDECLTQGTKQYPIERYSYVLANVGIFNGRNSNTFAKCLSSKCKVFVDMRVWNDAPGWLQPCPGGF